MALEPVRDLLYIIPIEPPLSSSSIIAAPETWHKQIKQDDGSVIELPQSTRRKPTQGIVKYRGPNTTGEIRVGDHVVFRANDGDELLHPSEGRLILLHENAVLAKFIEAEDVYVFTIPQLQDLVDKAVERLRVDVGRHQIDLNISDQEKLSLLGSKIKTLISTNYIEELYF